MRTRGTERGAKPRKRLGERLVQGATQLRDALASGQKIEERFTVRRVQLDLRPQEFSAADVKALRNRLRVSQALFAQVVGVSLKLVQGWEQGTHKPDGPALRLLDEIGRNPEAWIKRIRDAIRSKVSQHAEC